MQPVYLLLEIPVLAQSAISFRSDFLDNLKPVVF
jgi:hypothetical protein